MGAISLERLWPERFGDPNDAGPISPLRLPVSAEITRAGFERGSRGALIFEGETRVSVRLTERVWRYTLPDVSLVQTARRWRLEFGVDIDESGPLQPGHEVVVAQEPYANCWVQRANFKRYSKKTPGERKIPRIEQLEKGVDPVEWLERYANYDPWETGGRWIAGISHPHGFYDEARNSAGDLILGTCPDVDDCVRELRASPELGRLLLDTEREQIVFWNRAKVKKPPRLHPEVKEEGPQLMDISVLQSLAGPRHSPQKWIGRPVSKLAGLVYRDHLNERNRTVERRSRKHVQLFDDGEYPRIYRAD